MNTINMTMNSAGAYTMEKATSAWGGIKSIAGKGWTWAKEKASKLISFLSHDITLATVVGTVVGGVIAPTMGTAAVVGSVVAAAMIAAIHYLTKKKEQELEVRKMLEDMVIAVGIAMTAPYLLVFGGLYALYLLHLLLQAGVVAWYYTAIFFLI